ncbi:DUF5107 domain-containing protein [soil metagenome]
MHLPERPEALRDSPVAAWAEPVIIPTYPAMPPDVNPMFLEKRVYQGSSGRVYPNPVIDRISDERVDRTWQAIHLENRYIRLMILPEIGGRIHVGLDRTNGYDFFYRQNVIKPALVGLLGPWISGGVEFNWPQHHRPSTFMPVDWAIEMQPDGSATAWLSEHEPMERMKGTVGVMLYPDAALVEARVRLYNRTPLVQTFLWWANVAARVHDRYQSFFPPDVTFVADHAKRAMSTFPMSRGQYYGVDYGARTAQEADLSWYRNIPVPTSYMAMDTRHDFFGGYDHEREAGFVHWADHHIAPGKKQWTWGDHEFGYAWDRNLTDSDGPYVELMAGVFTDNQPDFSFLQPYETKTFSQFWYSIQRIGPAQHANLETAVSLVLNEDGAARIGVAASRPLTNARVVLAGPMGKLAERSVDLAPDKPFVESFPLPAETVATDLRLTVEVNGRTVITYRPEYGEPADPPPPATEPAPPAQMGSVEELFLTGLHLEQYRHATRRPEDYWQEALRREPGDSRANIALGRWHLRRGEFEAAEQHLRQAIATLTKHNPNPSDGEPYYTLGLVLRLQGRLDDAEAAFGKATWNGGWQSAGDTARAELAATRGEWAASLTFTDRALATNSGHLGARNLRAAILRRLDRTAEARDVVRSTLALDPLDAWALHEDTLLGGRPVEERLPGGVQTHLDVAHDYARAGLLPEAITVLERLLNPDAEAEAVHPLVHYTLAWLLERAGDEPRARHHARLGRRMPSDHVFPERVEEIEVLELASRLDPSDARAQYYLGNLLYDRRRYAEAVKLWERSARLDPSFSITHRNLGIAHYNVRRRPKTARRSYVRALRAAPDDARVLYEFDQLRKRLNEAPEERIGLLLRRRELVARRDDLSVELVTLLNQLGRHDQALTILRGRRFHPWEGGEGLVLRQWVTANLALARQSLADGQPEEALLYAESAIACPENIGEAKHLLAPENEEQYMVGLAHRAADNEEAAREWLTRAAARQGDPREGMAEAAYWQALAMRALGDEQAALALLRELLRAATRRASQEVRIDYFATSLPTFLLFEDDLELRNRVTCRYLQGLALAGLGRQRAAARAFRDVLALDVNHLPAAQRLKEGKSGEV